MCGGVEGGGGGMEEVKCESMGVCMHKVMDLEDMEVCTHKKEILHTFKYSSASL